MKRYLNERVGILLCAMLIQRNCCLSSWELLKDYRTLLVPVGFLTIAYSRLDDGERRTPLPQTFDKVRDLKRKWEIQLQSLHNQLDKVYRT